MRTAFFKFVRLLIVVFIVTFLSFSMLKLQEATSGSTIIDKVAPFGSPAAKERLRESLHLNESFFAQYGIWIGDAVRGDFGLKYTGTGENATTGTPVSEIVRTELPVSIELMIYAQILALLVALPLGIYTAYIALGATVLFSTLDCAKEHSAATSMASAYLIELAILFIYMPRELKQILGPAVSKRRRWPINLTFMAALTFAQLSILAVSEMKLPEGSHRCSIDLGRVLSGESDE